MVRYQARPGKEEQVILRKIMLHSPANVKKRNLAAGISGVMFVLWAACGIFFVSRGHRASGVLLLCFSAFFAAFAFGGAFWFQNIILKKAMKKVDPEMAFGEREYVFDEDGVQVISAYGEGKNPWHVFVSFGRIDHYLYLRRVDHQMVLVDENALTEGEKAELNRLLEKMKTDKK